MDGTDLATVVQARGPLSVADACLVLYQAALALKHIHEKGLVHRDMKPSNLIRDRFTGAVKILDLGLSGFNRSVLEDGGALTLTRDGVILGTPDYMAPEQVAHPHSVDIRADLYGLGCTLYDLLTGQPPFPEGTAADKVMAHLERAPRPLTEFVPLYRRRELSRSPEKAHHLAVGAQTGVPAPRQYLAHLPACRIHEKTPVGLARTHKT